MEDASHTGVNTESSKTSLNSGESTKHARLRLVPVVLALSLLGFVLVPPIRGHTRLAWTFAAVAGVLVVWQVLLWIHAARLGRTLGVELVRPLKTHYIQASIQICIYTYWGWYWPKVYSAAPLILGQLVFYFALDALLSWSRGRSWRIGFGPVPIILSVNLFMWFKSDWFVFQFVLLAACAFGKEFIRWNRDGKNTHVFNPSAFGLALCSIVLISTGTTRLTWGVEVATTLARPPHIYLQLFLLGLVVQYFFSVTLMTLSAVAVLCLLNLAYTGSTGVFQFVDTNIPIAVFLGLHLLVTDPSTSPRTNGGRVVFGSLYGAANFALFSLLGKYGVPDFYDKLLPVPILNLCVPWIDRFAHFGVVGRFERWQAQFQPKKLNLFYMGCWVALFATMLATGFVEAPHKGASIAFWKKAYEEGRPYAAQNLVKMIGSQADGEIGAAKGPACNELGLIYAEGKMAARNPDAAAHYFAMACELGVLRGCENLVALQLARAPAEPSERATQQALDRLEQDYAKRPDGRGCALLGFAYETGRGRPLDAVRATELYVEGCKKGNVAACLGLVRLGFRADAADLRDAARILERACESGDAQSCFYLAHLHHAGNGVRRDEARAQALLDRACKLGSTAACEAMKQPEHWPELVPELMERSSP